MTIIKPITLNIEETVWNDFKDKIPRRKTLNEAIVEIIKKFVYGK
jgi:hypothetical protein